MKLYEIDPQDITAYKLSTFSDKNVTGKLSGDYKSIMRDYSDILAEYKTFNRKSKRDAAMMQNRLGILMNNIVYIDNLCVDILNVSTDPDSVAIREKLDSIYIDLESMYNTF